MPASTVNLKSLTSLNLSECHRIRGPPEDFGKLLNLTTMNMVRPSRVRMLPSTMHRLSWLLVLNLTEWNKLVTPPA